MKFKLKKINKIEKLLTLKFLIYAFTSSLKLTKSIKIIQSD